MWSTSLAMRGYGSDPGIAGLFGVAVLEDAAEALGAPTKEGRPDRWETSGSSRSTETRLLRLPAAARGFAPAGLGREGAVLGYPGARPGSVYEHSELGYNYRMSNVLAGIGRGQLQVLELRVAQRRAIALRYREALEDLRGNFVDAAGRLWTSHELAQLLPDRRSPLRLLRDDLIRALMRGRD